MSDVGYVHLYRSLMGHPAFRNDAEALAFAWMVLRAAWRPARVRYKERLITLQRGQLAISVRDMASSLDRDKAWVERLWKRLKSETMIETTSETGVSIVTICNYNKFQPSQDTGETPGETKPETGARQGRDTEQRREKGKTEERIEPDGSKRAAARRAPAPDAFPMPDWADPAVWADFMTNRKRKRLPSTGTAYRGFLKSIAELQTNEWPPGRLLEYAAAKGWGSINPPDEMKASHHDRSPPVGRQHAPSREGDGFTRALDLVDETLARQRAGHASWAS